MGDGQRFRRLASDVLTDRRVLAMDLRGHGRSTYEPPWSIEAHLEDLRATLDAHDVGSADFIGFSFGGRLALELAATDSAHVRRMVLLDPAIQLSPATAFQMADAARNDQWFADEADAVAWRMSTLKRAPRGMVEEDLAGSFIEAPDGRLVYPVSRSAVVAAYGEMAGPPRFPTPRPTLLVRAAEGVVRDEDVASLQAAIGDDLTVLDVAGSHSVLWDAYDETASATVSILSK
jgi:lipase